MGRHNNHNACSETRSADSAPLGGPPAFAPLFAHSPASFVRRPGSAKTRCLPERLGLGGFATNPGQATPEPPRLASLGHLQASDHLVRLCSQSCHRRCPLRLLLPLRSLIPHRSCLWLAP